jgi:hypothetical protein
VRYWHLLVGKGAFFTDSSIRESLFANTRKGIAFTIGVHIDERFCLCRNSCTSIYNAVNDGPAENAPQRVLVHVPLGVLFGRDGTPNRCLEPRTLDQVAEVSNGYVRVKLRDETEADADLVFASTRKGTGVKWRQELKTQEQRI